MAESAAMNQKTDSSDDSIITLKVAAQDGREVFFRIRTTSKFERLMKAYGDSVGVKSVNHLRFLFDGNRINPEQTPASLEMEDGDVLDVMVEQQGGT